MLFAGEESLSTVRVFNASGKPVNGSEQQAADDTETETEYNSSSVPKELTTSSNSECDSPTCRGISLGMDGFNGLYGANMRTDSLMLTSM